MAEAKHAWLPETSCKPDCVQSGIGQPTHPALAFLRSARRLALTALLLTVLPVLALPMPGHRQLKRIYCSAVLRCLGVRITRSGGPIRNLRGMMVVSNHVSWVDVFAVGAVLPGTFVARADLADWPGVGLAARMANVIPIERRSLRQLPGVVDAVKRRLREGHTVVTFPEGTTYCGLDGGRFRPAMFQAAIDAGRPVQPLRLTYHHRDGSPSTVTAFFGDESLWASLKRTVCARRTVVHVAVRPLQLPGASRGDLAAQCHAAVRRGVDIDKSGQRTVQGHNKIRTRSG